MTKEDLQRAIDQTPDGVEVVIENGEGEYYGVARAMYDLASDEFVIEIGDPMVDEDGEDWDDDEGELDEDDDILPA